MIIGTVRPEEAKVFDSEAGYHEFHAEGGETYGSFEVFWADPDAVPMSEDWQDGDDVPGAGWYWWACFPGCMPDGEPCGPFASSRQALYDADEWHPDNVEG